LALLVRQLPLSSLAALGLHDDRHRANDRRDGGGPWSAHLAGAAACAPPRSSAVWARGLIPELGNAGQIGGVAHARRYEALGFAGVIGRLLNPWSS
jgi:hypothetical protein